MRFELLALASLTLVLRASGEETPQPIPIDQLDSRFALIGKLHAPLGKTVTISGVIVEGPSKGVEGGANLRVQKVDGRPTQEAIRIPLQPYFGKWGAKPLFEGETALPAIKNGETYEMEGAETGGYIGSPNGAYEKTRILVQSPARRFYTHFEVFTARKIEPLVFTPRDFLDNREALMPGIARTRDGKSIMEGAGWTVLVDAQGAWPPEIEGKQIETLGLYRIEDRAHVDDYTLYNGQWWLVRLEDQLGRTVALRGRALTSNSGWWFDYRNTRIHVEGMESLPGWSRENHARSMIIRGHLDRIKMPAPTDRSGEEKSAEVYVVRGASWEPLPVLLAPERPPSEYWHD